MGEEFYCVLKLVSGEEILSLIMIDENDGDSIIVLQNPVVIKFVQNSHGSFIKVRPWIEMSNEDFFIIRFDKVITMTETKDERLIKLYDKFISQDSGDNFDMRYTELNEGNKVKLSEKMGYISSVEEARKKLESLFKDPKES